MLCMGQHILCGERGCADEKSFYRPMLFTDEYRKKLPMKHSFFFFFFNASVLSGMLLNKMQKIFKGIKAGRLGGWIKNVLVCNSSISKISEVKKKTLLRIGKPVST